MIRDPGPAVTPFRFRRFRHRSPAKLAPFTIMTRSPLLALALACALLCVAPAFASSAELKSTSGAGGSCAGCTLVVDLIQKIAVQEVRLHLVQPPRTPVRTLHVQIGTSSSSIRT